MASCLNVMLLPDLYQVKEMSRFCKKMQHRINDPFMLLYKFSMNRYWNTAQIMVTYIMVQQVIHHSTDACPAIA